jgi:hypothetical protein
MWNWLIGHRIFWLVLFVKFASEGLGRLADNCYLTGWPVVSAICSTLVVAVSFRIAHLAVVKEDFSARLAICIAVFVTTLIGGYFLPDLVGK